jgi:dTDP-4-amino-4,6-dideoxygalactose transaminase
MQFIDLKTQYQQNEEKIRARIDKVLEHGRFIMGPEVREFEEQLEAYVGCKHAIGCANGSDALQLALMALEVGPGDAVFTTPFTFFATAEMISVVGATPVFVDIDEDTYNIDAKSLRQVIEKTARESDLNLKAVIAVDIFGLLPDYDAITGICEEFGLKLIEDAAQSFGGTFNGKRACSFGDIATTSFFPAKPLGCYGDGGALFTDNDELAEVLRSLRVHGGGKDKYDNVRIGLNSRLDTIQAAILLEKLALFPAELEAKQKVAARYNDLLEAGFITPRGVGISAWAQYSVRPRNASREEMLGKLQEAGIPSAVYYRQPLHLATAYKDLGYQRGSMPVAEKVAEDIFSLPMHAYLDEATQQKIAASVSSAQ